MTTATRSRDKLERDTMNGLQVDCEVKCEEVYNGLTLAEREAEHSANQRMSERWKAMQEAQNVTVERSTRYGIDDEDFADECPQDPWA